MVHFYWFPQNIYLDIKNIIIIRDLFALLGVFFAIYNHYIIFSGKDDDDTMSVASDLTDSTTQQSDGQYS